MSETGYVKTYRQEIETEAGRFMIEQRNVGFVDNDGKWIVEQLPELYWDGSGFLRERRPGAFLGVADDRAAVDALIAAATVQPETTGPRSFLTTPRYVD